jgi:hypothetical protein
MKSTVELHWFKSSYSSAQGDDCVEVAVTEETVCVRDSKEPSRPHFPVSHTSWTHFIADARVRGPL